MSTISPMVLQKSQAFVESGALVPIDAIERKIHFIRDQRVMLSTDLAALYEVAPRVLVQSVKRNIERFPSDFMFQITAGEQEILKSQVVISSWGGARRARPYAFTQEGVAMLSSVLRSDRAVQVNIAIMRVFVRMRETLRAHSEILQKITELEGRYDEQFRVVFQAIEDLMAPADVPSKGRIGFHIPLERDVAAAP